MAAWPPSRRRLNCLPSNWPPASSRPALATAEAIELAPQRDAWLARLAQAQAEAGGARCRAAYAGFCQRRSGAQRATLAKGLSPAAGRAGGAQADFDSLIELITTTVKPTTWDEVGGPGSVSEFRNGVYVDAGGVLRRVLAPEQAKGLAVARLAAISQAENVDCAAVFATPQSFADALGKARAACAWPPDAPHRRDAATSPGWKKFSTCWSILRRATWCWPVRPVPGAPTTRAATSADATGRPVVQLDDLVVLLR